MGTLPTPLISPEDLQDLIVEGEPLALADVRWVPGGGAREAFRRGHLADAVLLDVDADLAAPPFEGPGRHPLPSPEAFAAAMGRAGIGDATPVVVYDDARGSLAARLWWMLDVLGHPVALLDGGLQAWTGAIETGLGTPPSPEVFTARPWPQDAYLADADALVRALREGGSTVLDARAGERYRGEVEPLDPVAGHIPGAVSLPWTDMVDAETGRLLPAEGLRARYEAAGVSDAADAVLQCGSGVVATMHLLGLRAAGLGRGRLYAGSWSDWISDPSRPVATGPDPGVLGLADER